MTIDTLARRLGVSLVVSGLFLWAAAVVAWLTSCNADAPLLTHTIHHVVGWVFAVFGTVLLGVGLTLTATDPRSTAR